MTKISRDNFNKKELVNNLKSKFGTSTKNIEKIFDDIIDSLINIILSKNSISIKNLWTAQLKANGVNLIVPFKMGEAYRLIAFKKFFGSYSKSFSILLCERFLDIALITLLLILSFYISNLEVELLTNLIFLSVFVLFLILFFYYSFDEFLVLINRIFVGKKSDQGCFILFCSSMWQTVPT